MMAKAPLRTLQRTTFASVAQSYQAVSERTARLATELWIHDVVVQRGLCPFAAKSRYSIVVSNHSDDTKALVHDQARKLAIAPSKKGGEYLSTIIVFPHVRTMPVSVYEDVINDSGGRIGHMVANYEPDGTNMRVQAILFAGVFGQPKGWVLADPIQAVSPFPTIQLLRYQDLIPARGKDGRRGIAIRDKNIDSMDLLPPEEKVGMMQACIDKAMETKTSVVNHEQAKVIQTTRELPKREIEKLEQAGFQVEVVNARDIRSSTDAPTTTRLNIRPKRAKRQKGKRKKEPRG